MRRLQSSTAEMRQGIRVPENGYSETSVAFMDKVMEISGLGDKTFLPASARHSPYFSAFFLCKCLCPLHGACSGVSHAALPDSSSAGALTVCTIIWHRQASSQLSCILYYY